MVEDQTHLKATDREAFLESWLQQDRQKPFELSAPPLMRVAVIRFADNLVTWVWTFHHILMDGRSYLLVLEDFFACYEALCAGRPVALPERKPFADFISWHQEWMASHHKSAGAYWQKLFANDDADSVLSIARTSATTDHRQEKIVLGLETSTVESLYRLAKDHDLTVHAVVQGTWALLLSRYYRSQSVTFATIRACRNGSIEGAEGMIGMLMNLLPVHVRISPETSAIEFLKGIRAQQLAVRPYQWTPSDIIRKTIPAATAKQFFDSCVLYERHSIAQEMSVRFGKNGARTFSLRERSNFPLILSVFEKPQLQLELAYRPNEFEAKDIAQLGRSFLAVLHHILATPHAPIGSLELMDADDKASVIKKLSGPELTVPEDKGLHEWFEEQARRTPDALAIVGEVSLTYEQLDRRAGELAGRLIAMGVAPDQLVAIFLPRSAMTLPAILGVLKSGAAYFPLDVAFPKGRLKSLLEDSRAVAIITEEALASAVPAMSIPLVTIDGKQESLPLSYGQELPRIRGSQLAYVIATSGTTGRPKLIGVEHRQAANFLTYATQFLLQPEDVRCVPFIDSPSADSSVSQIFTTLALGGTLVLVPEILVINSSPYYEKFTCLGTVHTLLTIVLDSTGLPPSVRFIGLGAEAIPAELLERLDGIPQIKKVVNYYGPTETTVYCTVAILLDRANPQNRIDLHNRGRVIGRPTGNTQVYLLDESGQMVPPGALGEIYIGGALVARGYLNLPEKEGASFLPNHFKPDSGERMYRSGDLARLRPDGQMEFHGRIDHQLKFNGVRIEAAEIENALLSFPGVRQALVDLRPDAEGKKRFVAYVVAEGEDFPRQKLRKALRLQLPGAMIPQHFLVVESFPLATNGKVDRAALARLPLELEGPVRADASATPTECKLQEIWEKNLARSPIGLDQDYFEMGGDSLSSVNLLLAIEKHFGIRFKPQVLLESSTITEQARELENSFLVKRAPPAIAPNSLLPLQESGNQTPLILIPGGSGERFLAYRNFAHGFIPDHPVYALESPHTLMLEGPSDPIARLSTHFAQQITSLVKDRPFVLFGHCVGGLLAWHVACVLKKEKCPPFRLVLYDTPVPQKGVNVALALGGSTPKSGLQKKIHAYRQAWDDWRLQHGDGAGAKGRFLLWCVNNFFMRKGLDRSESGRDNFAKLAYLRALQSHPLSDYSDEALLLYHHAQEEAVSKSLWLEHNTGKIEFKFIPGNHVDWESDILNTIPLIHQQMESLGQQTTAPQAVLQPQT